MEDPSNGTVGTRLKTDGVAFELETMQTSRDSVEENGFHVIGDEIEDRVTRYPVGNSSAAGAVVNYVNTIVGAGIVGLPFALAQVRGGPWINAYQKEHVCTSNRTFRSYSVDSRKVRCVENFEKNDC